VHLCSNLLLKHTLRRLIPDCKALIGGNSADCILLLNKCLVLVALNAICHIHFVEDDDSFWAKLFSRVAHARLVDQIRAPTSTRVLSSPGLIMSGRSISEEEGAFRIDWAGGVSSDVDDNLGASTRLISYRFTPSILIASICARCKFGQGFPRTGKFLGCMLES
jgi:hypothetical protein